MRGYGHVYSFDDSVRTQSQRHISSTRPHSLNLHVERPLLETDIPMLSLRGRLAQSTACSVCISFRCPCGLTVYLCRSTEKHIIFYNRMMPSYTCLPHL